MKNKYEKLSAAIKSIPFEKIAWHIPLFINMVCLGMITACYYASGMRPYISDFFDLIRSDSKGFLHIVYLLGQVSWFLAALLVLISLAGKSRKRAIPGLCCVIVSFWFFFLLIDFYLD